MSFNLKWTEHWMVVAWNSRKQDVDTEAGVISERNGAISCQIPRNDRHIRLEFGEGWI